MAALLALVAFALSFTSAYAEVTLSSPPIGTVYDLLPDPYLTKPAFTPPFTGPEVPLSAGHQTTTNKPEQIGLFPAVRNGSFIFVGFTTPKASGKGIVYWGTNPAKFDSRASCDGKKYTYAKGYVGEYTSGYIFKCILGPLMPSTNYFYRVRGYGRIFDFKSLPKKGDSSILFGLMADVGQSSNASVTYSRMQAANVDLVLFAADLNYADTYSSLTCTPWNGTNDMGQATCGIGGVRWDSWARLAQKLFAYTPTAFIPGNHENEFVTAWNEVEPYKAYLARIPGLVDNNPYIVDKYMDTASYSKRTWSAKSPIFYSLDIGPAHIIGIASYSSFSKYTHQDYWLKEDLCKFNRSLTPWLIVFMHAPWYNSDRSHYLEGEPLRTWYEPYLYNATTDIVIAGHVHAYERSHPVYNMRLNPCGPIYVTVGDGGNVEGVAGPFLEPQPEYSAYRELTFGHATFEIINATNAKYTWYRNQVAGGVVGDSFDLVNKYLTCGPKKPTFC